MLLLKPTPNLELLANQFKNTTPENINETENVSSSKYYDIDEMHNTKILTNNEFLPIFHINACYLDKRFDDLQHLLSCLKNNSDMIATTDTRRKK